MEMVTLDENLLESIALSLSGTSALPHRSWHNRHKRYCYIVALEDPTTLYCSLAFKTDDVAFDQTAEGRYPVPITGDTCTFGTELRTVIVFIAYSLFRDRTIISSHCEKVVMPIDYVYNVKTNTPYHVKGGNLLKGIPLSVVNNVTNIGHRS